MLTEEELKAHIAKDEYMKIGEKTTICLLTLDNGFEVVGYSAPIDKENYDEEIGKNVAYESAFNKLRELYGFLAHNK